MAVPRASVVREIERIKLLVLKQLKEYGSFHPSLLFSLGCLARLRQQRREYAKAERIYRRALELCANSPSSGLHVVRLLLAGYASLLHETGRGDQARWLRENAQGCLATLQQNPLPEWEWFSTKVVCLN